MVSLNKSHLLDWFEIERIISRRSTESETEYFIKWKNLPEDKNTWEPLSKLKEDQAHRAISFFELQRNDTPPKDVTLYLTSYKEITLRKREPQNMILDEDDNRMEEDWMNGFGSLPKDSIKRIIKLEVNNVNKEFYALVEWNKRALTGIQPPDSLVKTSKLKKYHLLPYILFLESIMYTDKERKEK